MSESSAPTARWGAVVVNFESGPLLAAAVASLLVDESAGRGEVVVVDNASRDDSVARLRAAHPDVPVIEPGANLGYSRAANLGIAATRAPVIAVCNPDIVVEPGATGALVARFETEPDLGALGPAVLNEDGSAYPTGRATPSIGAAIAHATLGRVAPENRWTRDYLRTDEDPTVARDAQWVSGAAIWLRREALDAVGGWDEGFFLFMEDVDLCRRLRLAGWRVGFEPAARVVHLLGASRATVPYRSIYEHHRAAYRYASKWWVGARRALLPAAAAFLAARGGALALSARARAGREAAPPAARRIPAARAR